MRQSHHVLLIFFAVSIWFVSCAGKQEQAARLEREIMSQDTALSIATLSKDSQSAASTEETAVPSADAVPPSEIIGGEVADVPSTQSDTSLSPNLTDSVLALVANEMHQGNLSPMTVAETAAEETAPVEEVAVSPVGMPRREIVGKYTVQIAASTSEGYALGLVDTYTKKGFEPFIDQKIVNGTVWYRVRIGQCETTAEATALRDQLAERYFLQAWVDNVSH